MGESEHRDLIVVGASAGGVAAVPRLLGQLSPELPAAVVVVQHLHPSNTVAVADIFARTCALPVRMAEQGSMVRHGEVIIAPPGVHTVLADDHVLLVQGAKENRARPSINRLFRSAAATHAGRTIGVLLTGMLDDGVAGLGAIKRAGGLAVVQAPDDAEYPELPTNALDQVDVDHVLPVASMGAALSTLIRDPAPPGSAPRDLLMEAELDRGRRPTPDDVRPLGPQTPLSCPACAGPMWEVGDAQSRTYRCYLGHTESARSLLTSQSTALEESLWAAVRALQERAATLSTLARDARRRGRDLSADEFEASAAESRAQAERARQFLLELQPSLDRSQAGS
jgi:two-component system, chemotaxis family, protein-glutamate methylesterase/glutaminase